jgi:hypothetical protein
LVLLWSTNLPIAKLINRKVTQSFTQSSAKKLRETLRYTLRNSAVKENKGLERFLSMRE